MTASTPHSSAIRPIARAFTSSMAPSGADLDGKGKIGRLSHGLKNSGHPLRVAHQRRPRTGLDDLFHRATHIHVDKIGPSLNRHPYRFRQRLRIGTEKLNPKRPVGGRGIEVTAGLAHPPDKTAGTDHLGKGEAAAELTHNRPERQIRDPRHRGETDCVLQT